MVPDTGHNLPIEQPALFTAALLGFTGGVDACARRAGKG
jgi:pimeloyl-ACP methyl ester carboxylesterase